jgi:hypothetical protein
MAGDQAGAPVIQLPPPGEEPDFGIFGLPGSDDDQPRDPLDWLRLNQPGPGVFKVVTDIRKSPLGLRASSLYTGAKGRCGDGIRGGCDKVKAFDASIDRMGSAVSAYPLCHLAANAMAPHYESGTPPQDIARIYDRGCFGAFGVREGEFYPAATPPPLLRQPGSGEALLASIGIVLRDGRPDCAGLLTRQRRFITAGHCAETISLNPVVIQASTGTAWKISDRQGPTDAAGGPAKGTANDWAAYAVNAGEGYAVPAVRFADMKVSTSATVIAAYPHLPEPVQTAQALTGHMRYSRPGLCEAIDLRANCLALLCQTIRGFSGAPIFRSETGDGVPEVLGFVSGSQNNNSGCQSFNIADVTLAVGAKQIPEGLLE